MRSRVRRQPALPLLASEFGESTLHQQGSGEYDPLFLITKLGAKVNRVIVAGLLELFGRGKLEILLEHTISLLAITPQSQCVN